MRSVISEKEVLVDGKRVNKIVRYDDGTMESVFVRNLEDFKEKKKYNVEVKPPAKIEEQRIEEKKTEEKKPEEIKPEISEKKINKIIQKTQEKKQEVEEGN